MKIGVLEEEIEAMVSFLGKGGQGFVFVTLLVSDRFEVVSCLRLAVDVVVGVTYACDRWSVVSDRLAALEWKSVPLEGSLVCNVVEGVCRFGSFMCVGLVHVRHGWRVAVVNASEQATIEVVIATVLMATSTASEESTVLS